MLFGGTNKEIPVSICGRILKNVYILKDATPADSHGVREFLLNGWYIVRYGVRKFLALIRLLWLCP